MTEKRPVGMSEVEVGDIPTQVITNILIGQLKRFIRLRKAHEEVLNARGIGTLNNVIVARIRDLNGLVSKEQVSQIIKSSEAPKM